MLLVVKTFVLTKLLLKFVLLAQINLGIACYLKMELIFQEKNRKNLQVLTVSKYELPLFSHSQKYDILDM